MIKPLEPGGAHGPFLPTPSKGKLGRRVKRAYTPPSGLLSARQFSQQFQHSFQTVPLAIGIDASGVRKVNFCNCQPSKALFLLSRVWANIANIAFATDWQGALK